MFPAIVTQREYSVYAFNQSAPRAFRRDLYSSLKRTFAEYFEGRDAHKDQELYTRKTEDLHEKIEKKFIDENFDEDKMPDLDYEININEGE